MVPISRAEQLCEFGADGVGEEGVAFDTEVEEVGRDVAAQGSCGVEEFGAGVDEVDSLAIR